MMILSTCVTSAPLSTTVRSAAEIKPLSSSNTGFVQIDPQRLKHLLEIEKNYVTIIAAGVKQRIEAEKASSNETVVLRGP